GLQHLVEWRAQAVPFGAHASLLDPEIREAGVQAREIVAWRTSHHGSLWGRGGRRYLGLGRLSHEESYGPHRGRFPHRCSDGFAGSGSACLAPGASVPTNVVLHIG